MKFILGVLQWLAVAIIAAIGWRIGDKLFDRYGNKETYNHVIGGVKSKLTKKDALEATQL